MMLSEFKRSEFGEVRDSARKRSRSRKSSYLNSSNESEMLEKGSNPLQIGKGIRKSRKNLLIPLNYSPNRKRHSSYIQKDLDLQESKNNANLRYFSPKNVKTKKNHKNQKSKSRFSNFLQPQAQASQSLSRNTSQKSNFFVGSDEQSILEEDLELEETPKAKGQSDPISFEINIFDSIDQDQFDISCLNYTVIPFFNFSKFSIISKKKILNFFQRNSMTSN